MPESLHWTAADMPDLAGRAAVVTGANSGIGFHAARELAIHGASVTLAVRSRDRGEQAAERILAEAPRGAVLVETLDVADLSSVREFASSWSTSHPDGLDLLVNNAGVMATPRRTTVDGFELQFATNHLGHFALTGLLLPALVARPRSRVVTVSSGVHRYGRMDFDDLMSERRYFRWSAYGQSKLANLLFTTELQRRLDANAVATLAMAAHPGYSATNLQRVGLEMDGRSWMARTLAAANKVVAQSPQMGALPTLFAATAPGLPGNSYIGPGGLFEQHGFPVVVDRSRAAKSDADARRLWLASERLTGVRYPLDVA